MENKTRTSKDAFAEYTKLKAREEELIANNKGFNLLGNFNEKKPRGYFISLMVKTRLNLKNKEEKIVLNSDFPFVTWRYSYDRENGIQDFLDELVKYCKKPVYKYPFQRNRKQDNKVNTWNMPEFREKKVAFEDIEFNIGEKAHDLLFADKIDFVKMVKDILEYQKELTDEEKADFDKYFFLYEKIENTKRQLKSTSSYYSNKPTDNTLTFNISKQEYNEKLKEIEVELNSLCDKHEVLEMPSIYYKEIIKKKTLDEFKEESIENLRDSWDNDMDEEDRDRFDGDFDEFLKQKYEEFLEYSDFDE